MLIMMNWKNLPAKAFLIVLTVTSSFYVFGNGYDIEDPYGPSVVINTLPADTIPLEDRYGDFLTDPNRNPFDLQDPESVKKEVEYDPSTGLYMIRERIGDDYFRSPTYMTFEEYMEWRAEKENQNYFDRLSGAAGDDRGGLVDPMSKFDLSESLVDRLFGGTKVDIRPQGSIDLTFGWNYSRREDPGLTVNQQTINNFDFLMNINMSVEGKIGEKLRLSFNYNNRPTFDFDNQMKLQYDPTAFSEDDILQNVEVGNVSLPLRSTLIQGAQSLFGVMLDTKWGPLRLKTIVAQQKSDRKQIQVQGGAQYTEFEVFADEYEENRHYFLSHYNRNTFEESLEDLPVIRNVFSLERVQVYVTDDRNTQPERLVDIVALADLGESEKIAATGVIPSSNPPLDYQNRPLPDNSSNDLYAKITQDTSIRQTNRVVSYLQGNLNLQAGRDFEKVRAIMLQEGRDFTVNKELGYVTINYPVQPDHVVGVSYQYSYNGEIYTVGEISGNVPPTQSRSSTPGQDPNQATTSQTVVYTKMLKSATQRVDLPMWDLMMKNVYNIGAYNLSQEDFIFNVYYDEPGIGEKQFLPTSTGSNAEIPLLRFFNLDRLNDNNDPPANGEFDFIPGLTVTSNGRIMIPVLEPFGSTLYDKIVEAEPDRAAVAEQLSFQVLYDSTVTRAREYPDKNRFVLRGSYKGESNNVIQLNTFNLPQGSETVRAGSQQLERGTDYEIDYATGRITILNQAYISSGVPINVSFEDNSLFGFQQKNLIGLRADYDVSKNLVIGGTYMHLFERPFTQKVNIGDDPINNRVYGLDFSWGDKLPWLTKAVDAIPLLDTKEESNFTLTAEGAAIQPGHSKAINETADESKGGVVLIDDFEGAFPEFTLSNAAIQEWNMASIPANDINNNNPLFPEADAGELLPSVNRALLNWFLVDNTARSGSSTANDPYVSIVDFNEIYREGQRQSFQNLIRPLVLSYFPNERGVYNFERPDGTAYSSGMFEDGKLKDPGTRWAGITRQLQNNDFQATNVEFIEFWMLSPFLDPRVPGQSSGTAQDQQGTLYINLGNVSEDVLKDSELSFENGLPGPPGTISADRQYIQTDWGRVPAGPVVTEAFDNDEAARNSQDIGLDGLTDEQEMDLFSDYLEDINNSNLNPAVKQEIAADPSNDNFRFFTEFDSDAPVIEKYKSFSKPQGNSPVNTNSNIVASSRLKPDSEDLNDDKTLNESESYFQYKIPIEWDGQLGIKFNKYVTDSVQVRDGNRDIYRVWYNFKIPITQYDAAVGGIQDFRSIRFIRMYLKDFQAPVNLAFVDMKLTRSQWRRYLRPLKEDGVNVPDQYPATGFDITDVGLEENSTRQPFNYVLPRGIQREQNVGGFQPGILQDERSLAIRLNNLRDGDARGVYKLNNLDFRVYERMKMFVHAETEEIGAQDGDLEIFIRVGSDFEDNYYEYSIPLNYSDSDNLPQGDIIAYSDRVWLEENAFDFPLELFTDIKKERNSRNFSLNYIFESVDPEKPANRTRIKGNPDLGKVRGIMIGVRNPFNDGVPHTAEIWVNELRLNGLDERGGVAGIARLDVQLADFGQLSASTQYSSIGYGGIEERLAQRSQEENIQYDFAASFELGKFFGKDFGLKIPFLWQYSKQKVIPRFDPYTRDIEFDDLLDDIDPGDRDSVYNASITQSEIQSINFNNVRKNRNPQSDKKPMPWNIENIALSYSLTERNDSDPQIEFSRTEDHYGTLDYNYSARPFYWQPFKKLIKNDKFLKFISEFNLNPVPSNLAFGMALDRNYQVTKQRFAGTNPFFNTFYQKQFLWNRNYALSWDFTKSLKFNYNATTQAIIDELEEFDEEGNPRTQGELNDYIWENLRNFGRTKNFTHNFSLSYTLPLKYFPLLDFMNIRAQYNANYTWAGASLNALELGNVISNQQKRDVNAEINFEKLYNKSKYLKSINGSNRRRPTRTPRRSMNTADDKKDQEAESEEDADKKKKKNDGPSTIEKVLIRPLMLMRNVRFRYTEDYGTIVPGFMPQAKFFGQNEGFTAPGWDFVAGWQPDDAWFNRASVGENGVPWVTTNFFLNQKVQQTYSQNIDGKLTIEPLSDFRVDVEMRRRYTENHSELFKDADQNGTLERLLPQDVGSLEVTYFTANTLFGGDPDGIGLFQQFEENRAIISQRIGVEGTEHSKDGKQYTEGYGKYQQDVLIPAFLAAYSGEDANTTLLDVFKTVPKPNWTLNYGGLAKIPGLSEIFSTISIKHGYRSTMVINTYNTSLFFDQDFAQESQENLNPETESYFARLEIPNIILREGFSPLIAIDVKTKDGISFNLGMDKQRDLELNLTSYQLAETKSTSFEAGFAYTIKEVEFGFLQGGKTKKKEDEKPAIGNQFLNRTFGGGRGQSNPQDLNIAFNMQLQDNVTINHFLDKDIHEKIRGQYQLRISPSVDYQLNQRLNLRLFVDYTLTKPKTSATAPQTQIFGGLNIQFTLN